MKKITRSAEAMQTVEKHFQKMETDEMREIMQDLEFLEWAAEDKHNSAAMFFLASKYYYGDGVVQNTMRAIEYLKHSAEMGFSESAQLLAIAYRDGEGIKQDYEESVKWFLIAANAGLTDSMYSLYLRYKLGQGVQQSISDAMSWLIKAADAGHAVSQRILSENYYYGDNGLPEDKSLAFQYALKAAKQNDAEAAYCVALSYIDGDVVDKNLRTAKYWLEIASNQNYVDAQLDLARMLLREKTETSFKEAIEWLTRGAALGNSECQYGLKLLTEMQRQGISLVDL